MNERGGLELEEYAAACGGKSRTILNIDSYTYLLPVPPL